MTFLTINKDSFSSTSDDDMTILLISVYGIPIS